MILVLVVLLFFVGLQAVLSRRHLVKKILGIVILEHAVNLGLVVFGYRHGGGAPIMAPEQTTEAFVQASVDPLPQALVLTSIVIGLSAVMLMVALSLRVAERYGTFDTAAMSRLRG